MALKLQTAETDSAGNAMDRYGTYAKSTEAKMNDLKNATQQFWINAVNSDVINNFISGVTNIVNNLQALQAMPIQVSGAIGILTAALIALTVATFHFKADVMSAALMKILTSAGETAVILRGMSVAEGLATVATEGLTVAARGLTTAAVALFSSINILIGVLALVTAGAMGYVQHMTDLKEQTDKNKASIEALTKAMKENNAEAMKSGSTDLEGQQSNYRELLKQKQVAEANLKKVSNTTTGNAFTDQNALSKAQIELERVNSLLSDQKQVLKDAGAGFNELTGEIYKVTAAQARLTDQKIITGIKNTTKAEIDNKDGIIKLYAEYKRLISSHQDASIQAQDLANRIAGVTTATDENGNTVVVNTGLIDKEIQMFGQEGLTVTDLANAKMEAAKSAMSWNINETQVTYEQIKQRIKYYGDEINALNALMAKQSQQYTDAQIKGGIAPDGTTLMTPAEASQRKAGNDVTQGIYQSAQNSIDAIYNSLSAPSSSTPTDGYPPSGTSADKAAAAKKAADDAAAQAKKNSQALIDQWQEASDAVVSGYEKQIDAINAKADAEKRATQELEYQNKLIKIQNELKNTQNEKNVRLYSNGGWTWVADQQQITKLKDDLATAKTDYSSWQADNAKTDQIASIQSSIDAEKARVSAQVSAEQKKINGYASGTDYVPKTDEYLVGENGPEKVILAQGSKVIPNNKLSEAPTQNVTSATGKLLGDVDQSVKKFVDSAKNYSKDLDKNMGDSLTVNDKLLKEPLDNLISDVSGNIQTFVDDSPTYGKDMNDNIGKAITSNDPLVINPMNAVITKLQTGITDFVKTMYPSGTSTVSELGNGITNSTDAIATVVDTLTAKIITQFKTGFGIASPSTVMYEIGDFMMQGLINGMTDSDVTTVINQKVSSSITAAQAAMGSAGATGDVTSWLTQAIQATGIGMENLAALQTIAMKESGGNPNSINLTDSNAIAGHPSQGLMQTIPSTFNAYKLAGHDNILNPVDNAIAAIRYILARYGSVNNVPGIVSMRNGGAYKGYAKGTDYVPRTGEYLVGEEGVEKVILPEGAKVIPNNKLLSGDLSNSFRMPNLDTLKSAASAASQKISNYNFTFDKVVAENVDSFVRQAKTFTAVRNQY